MPLKGICNHYNQNNCSIIHYKWKNKEGQSTSRNSMCWQNHLLSIIAVHNSPKTLSTPRLYMCSTWANRVPNMHQLCVLFKKYSCCHLWPATVSCLEGSQPSSLQLAPAVRQSGHLMAPGTALGYVLWKGIPELCTDSKGIQGQLLDHFTFLETFPVLLSWMSLCRDPRQGFLSSLRANLTWFLLPCPAPSGFTGAAAQPKLPHTSCPLAPTGATCQP